MVVVDPNSPPLAADVVGAPKKLPLGAVAVVAPNSDELEVVGGLPKPGRAELVADMPLNSEEPDVGWAVFELENKLG